MLVQDAPVVKSGLEKYIARCGGSDTLEFETCYEALDAASALRRGAPELRIEARYTKVFIRTPKENA